MILDWLFWSYYEKKGFRQIRCMCKELFWGYVFCKKKQVKQIAGVVSLETKGKLKKVPVGKLSKQHAGYDREDFGPSFFL